MQDVIENRLKELGMTKREFLEKSLMSIKNSESAAYAFLNKESYTAFEQAWLALKLNLPFDAFGGCNEDFEPVQKGDTDDPHTSLIFRSFDENKDPKDEFIQEYFGLLRKAVKKTQKTIFIYDFLSIRDGVEYSDYASTYIQNHKKYLTSIEEQLSSNEQVQYRRFIALPLAFQSFSHQEPYNRETAFGISLGMLFKHTVEHIVRCFTQFPQRFELYLLAVPIRLYSFGTIDDVCSLSEYERIDNDGVSRPSKLFINQGYSNQSQEVIKSYNKEFAELSRDISSKFQYRLFLSDFYNGLQRELEKTRKRIEYSKNQIPYLYPKNKYPGSSPKSRPTNSTEQNIHYHEKMIVISEELEANLKIKLDVVTDIMGPTE